MSRGLMLSITLCLILPNSRAIAGSTTLVSGKSQRNQSNGASSEPSASDTGQFIAFRSPATNLAAARCNNGFNHTFVHDRTTGTTTCVSVHSSGTEGNGDSFDPSISANGQMVTFHSSATNLTNRCTNGNSHVYVHDLTTGQTRCVSVDSNENPSDGNSDLPKISGDGLFVAFESDATNLTSQCDNAFAQIFVRDLTNGRTSCASMDNNENQGNNDSVQPSISSDGRLVAFSSVATNLTPSRCIAGKVKCSSAIEPVRKQPARRWMPKRERAMAIASTLP